MSLRIWVRTSQVSFLFLALASCASRRFNSEEAARVRAVDAGPAGVPQAVVPLATAPEPGCDASKVYGRDNPVCNWGEFPAGGDLRLLPGGGADFTNYGVDQTEDALSQRYGLAGGVVLAAMKDMFDRYNAYIKYLYTKKEKPETYKFGSEQLYDAESYVKTIKGCMNTGYDPYHWNDIQLHYYCVNVTSRVCYTLFTGQDVIPRAAAVDACSRYNKTESSFETQSAEPEDHGKGKTVYWDNRRIAGAVDFRRFFFGIEDDPQAKAFAKLNGEFEYKGKTYKHIDVFRYVMFAKTFAFPDSHQNRVINEFWAYLRKGAHAAEKMPLMSVKTAEAWAKSVPENVFAANPNGCEFREWRKFSEQEGTHCQEDARRAKKYKLAPKGR